MLVQLIEMIDKLIGVRDKLNQLEQTPNKMKTLINYKIRAILNNNNNSNNNHINNLILNFKFPFIKIMSRDKDKKRKNKKFIKI